MKKLGIFLAVAQLAACLNIPAMAEDNTTIKIEAENYKTVTTKFNIGSGSDYSGGKIIEYCYAQPKADDDYIISYTVNIPKTAKYELRGVANIRSVVYTTDWSVYINDESNAPAAYTKVRDVTTANYPGVIKEYSMGKFKLKKGINTLYVKVDKTDVTTSNGMIFIADYFTLSSAENDSFELESISFPDSKLGAFDEGSDVKLNFDFTAPAPESISYRFEIQDLYERDVLDGTFTVEKGKDTGTLNFGSFKNGWYRVYLYENGSERAMNKFISFTVTKPISQRTDFEATAFAADVGYASGRTAVDYAKLYKRAGISYVRGRGSAHHADGNPVHEKTMHEYGIDEISDHDPGAVLGSDGSTRALTGDLNEAYANWKATPAANGYYAEGQEVLNEMDLAGSAAVADVWAAYFKAAAIGISDGHPEAIKAFAGLAGYDSSYIHLTMQNDILSYSDVYNYHAHSDYEMRPSKARLNANAYSDEAGIPVWGTEIGYPQTLDEGKTVLNNDQMKLDARGAIVTAILQFANGSNKNFYFLATPYVENGKSFSFVTKEEEFTLPSYAAIATMTDALGEGTIKGEIANLPVGGTGYMFDDGRGNDAAVIWSESQGYVELVADEITYVDMVGYKETKKDTDGDGKISVYVTPYPCFILFNGRSNAENYYPMQYNQNTEPKKFTMDERVVIQPLWDCNDRSIARENGYELAKNAPFEMKLKIYNFNDTAVQYKLNIMSEDLVKFEDSSLDLSFEPWETKEIVLKGTTSPEADNGTKGFAKFYLTNENGEETSRAVSKVHITNRGRSIAPDDMVYFEDIWDANNWNLNNVATGGKVIFEGNEAEKCVTLDAEFTHDSWTFPQYKIENPERLEGSSGIAFWVKCTADKKAGDGIGCFIHMKDGRQYYCGSGNTRDFSTEWEQVVLPWSVFYLYSSPLGAAVDTRQFEFKDVASISIGYSAGNAPSYTVKEYGYFYSDNPSDYFQHTDMVTLSGVEQGRKYQKGENLVITAELPENDYISYKVMNRNDMIENYTVDGNTITIDCAGYERGSYRLYVFAETKMNGRVMGSIDFYIE